MITPGDVNFTEEEYYLKVRRWAGCHVDRVCLYGILSLLQKPKQED